MNDYYDDILNFYEYSIPTRREDLIWINRKLIEISQNCLEHGSKKQFINCLILIQNLFMTKIPDHSYHKGKLIKMLNTNEYKAYTKILQEELAF